MKNSLKVLSIDFDYFQKTDPATIVNCYPDGNDLPTYLTEITWMSQYSQNAERLNKVRIDRKKLNDLYEILEKQSAKVPVMITQSHIHIYDFIKDHISKNTKAVNIVNIDMHHDCFNNNEKLDCGNWVEHAVKDFKNCSVIWIANKISQDVYCLKSKFPVHLDFKPIQDMQFDLIFLCRSDTWLPPHLDKHFDELYKYFMSNHGNVTWDKQIEKPRDIVSIRKQARECRKQIEEMRSMRLNQKQCANE